MDGRGIRIECCSRGLLRTVALGVLPSATLVPQGFPLVIPPCTSSLYSAPAGPSSLCSDVPNRSRRFGRTLFDLRSEFQFFRAPERVRRNRMSGGHSQFVERPEGWKSDDWARHEQREWRAREDYSVRPCTPPLRGRRRYAPTFRIVPDDSVEP